MFDKIYGSVCVLQNHIVSTCTNNVNNDINEYLMMKCNDTCRTTVYKLPGSRLRLHIIYQEWLTPRIIDLYA